MSVEEVKAIVERKFRKADREYIGFEYFFSSHLKIVKDEAENLLESYDADEEVVKLGALVHDAGYLEDPENHEEGGFEVAKNLLEEAGVELSDDRKEKLRESIEEHGYSGEPESLEAKIVAAADALAHLRPEFVMGQAQAQREKGKSREEIEDWFREKFEKDLKKAGILRASSRKASKYHGLYGDFSGSE
jgi:putative nucleotidyltransferase with HDIG domain